MVLDINFKGFFYDGALCTYLIFPCLCWPNEFDRAAPAVHKVPENVRVKAIPGLNVGFLPTVLPCIFVAEVRT